MTGPAGRITKDFAFDIKAVSDAGVIEGYASVFDNVDNQGDVIAAGAFTRSISAWAAKGMPVPVLWQHDAFNPIGATTSITEDGHGLRIKTELVLEVQKAREAYALAQKRVLGGLSIGFSVASLASDGQPAVVFDEERNARVFREVKLWEYSLVTFPANAEAVLTSVKHDEPPAWVADLTSVLRELRVALDDREQHARLLREVRSILAGMPVPSVGTASGLDPALSGVLRETRNLLISTKGAP